MTDDKRKLVLADGTVILSDGSVEQDEPVTTPDNEYVEIPRNDEAVSEIAYRRRMLSDLPETPDRMNLLSVVATYHILGVSNQDIATVIGCDVERVERVLLSDAFIELQKQLVEQVLERDADDIRSVFSQGARSAARKVESLTRHHDPSIALSASKDLLDRSGHRPADVVEHRHKVEGGLTINYIQKKDESDILDAPFKVLTDGET